ncbi:hypothetical protein LV779_30890 [Streptomyces thinghirensis]|nr:hypothetical protein [Streptomyces thinghirensis]
MANEIGPDRVAMILHPKNITDHDLPAMYAAGARLVRIILPSKGYERGLEYIRQAKEIGFRVGVNFARISQWAGRDVVDVATAATDAGADFVYLADSNGSLSPVDTTDLTTPDQVGHRRPGRPARPQQPRPRPGQRDQRGRRGRDLDGLLDPGHGQGARETSSPSSGWHTSTAPTPRPPAAFTWAPPWNWRICSWPPFPKAPLPCRSPDLVLGRYDLPVEHRKDLLGGDHRAGVATARTLATVR